MPIVNLSDEEAEKFAGWLNDRFDDERRSYRDNKANDYDEDAADDLKTLTLINTVYKQLAVPVFGNEDLFEAHGIKEDGSFYESD
jgi:hypothetical protein